MPPTQAGQVSFCEAVLPTPAATMAANSASYADAGFDRFGQLGGSGMSLSAPAAQKSFSRSRISGRRWRPAPAQQFLERPGVTDLSVRSGVVSTGLRSPIRC